MSTLKTKLSELGITSDELDGLVDEGASRLVSRVNNEGMSKQLRFLEEQVGMSENDILAAVQSNTGSIEPMLGGGELTQFIVTGRCCDHDDHVKVVYAESEDDAEKKFEQHVRQIEDVQDGDFYIEHIETLSYMVSRSI